MSYLIMPVRTDIQAYNFTIDLERKNYFLDFHWNGRAGLWVMSIGGSDEVFIVAGIPVTPGAPLLNRFHNPLLPPGTFFCLDTTGQNLPPTADNFGIDVKLVYRESTTIDG